MIHQGPPVGGAWSGVPAGLTEGMRSEGAEVVHVNAAVPGAGRIGRRLRMSWADRSASHAFAAASSQIARRGVRKAKPLDGSVMIGSGYTLSAGTPYVTFDDMTVAQALRMSEPAYDALGEKSAARWRRRQAAIYRRAVGCCLSSEWAAGSVRDDYGIEPAKVHVVWLGANAVTTLPERDWSRPRFLFVGFDWERKRGAAVVDAFAEVRRRHPEAALHLVGGHPRIEAEGVTGHGPLPLSSAEGRRRYTELLGEATCLVMPSTFEPFGIAYLDAAHAGIPSIGTAVGGAPEAIGDCGRVVDPADPRALLETMLELSDPAVAARLGECGRRRAPELTWQAVARRVLGILLPQSGGGGG